MNTKLALGLLAGALAFGSVSAKAEALLSDDFEDYTATSGLGSWTVEDPSNSGKTWSSVGNGLSGKRSAQGGGTDFTDEGTYDVTLVSPVLSLEAGKSYKVDFIWQQSKTAVIENHCNDLLVQVREPGGAWTTVFASDDPALCEASGVAYPWGTSGNWEINHSIVDISDFAGKQVQVGFTWRKNEFDRMYANVATIDDVLIDEYSPAKGAVGELSQTAYQFPTTWVGTISNSEIMTLANTGKDNLKITSIEGLDGSDFTIQLDYAAVDLKPNYGVQFTARYTPTVEGSAATTVKFNIEGGDPVELTLRGTKRLAPEGYTPENFEGAEFPPVGWTRTGNWNALNSSFSGDRSVYVNLTMSPAVHYLTSPRLDLSGQDNFVAFTYINQLAYMTDDLYGAENYVDFDLSTDGGQTWTNLWRQTAYVDDPTAAQITLGSDLGNNCYVRWAYYIPDLDPTIYDYEYSNFFLDAVVLPPLYGAGDAPQATTPVAPANGAKDQINSGLTLSWAAAQFASSYKLSLGTAADNFDILSAVSVEGTSYTAPRLEYSTTYYWTVVPTNDSGDAAGCPVWSFTTMADQSIKNFPYAQDFEEPDNKLPLGWGTTAMGSTKWDISKIGPFDGKQIAFASGTTSNTEAILTTPEIVLPAGEPMMVSFYWANGAPGALYIDETGSARNTTTAYDGNDGCYLEIAESGTDKWAELALISEDSQYWVREAVSLGDYAGKIVQLRWRYNLTYGNGRRGISLDNIAIQSESGAAPAYFNVQNFNFGEVNANTVGTSKSYVTITNGSLTPVTIASIDYSDSRFSSSLAAGQTLEPNKAIGVELTFAAGNVAESVEATIRVNFEGGKNVELPLEAVALPATTLYFDFEDDEHGSKQPEGLTAVDVDGLGTVQSSVIKWPGQGSPFAFIVLNVTLNYSDWRNVYPRSGDQVLAALRTTSEYSTSDDWLISPKMKATATSQFRFFGKSYATTDEFNDFTHHTFEVWVSTTDKDIKSFTTKVKKQTELAYSKEGKFTEYTIDLGDFDGQEIYVGLRHIAPINSYVAFFDDLYYENFDSFDLSGITMVEAPSLDAPVYYNLQGVEVAPEHLVPGIYIERSAEGVRKVLIK